MNKKNIFLTIVLLMQTIIGFANENPMHKGVLRIELNKFKSNTQLHLYNKDGSLFATAYRDEEDGEYKIKRNNKVDDSLLKDIRAYYLDYGLMIFDADSIKMGQFPVYIGNQTKFVKASEIKAFISFQTWSAFLKTVFLKTTKYSCIYTDTVYSKKVQSAEKYSYSVKQINGEWAYVECLKTCEECPKEIIIKGWVKWKDGNKLLIDLYYFC